jgi:uncharacterized membrane protein
MDRKEGAMNTSLQFTGDWNPWLGIFVGLVLAVAAWFLYRRETYRRGDARRWILPTLRAVAVFLVVLVLTGPVLHHEKIIRELGRLFVFVDASKSMELTDEDMQPERKVASMQSMGMLPRGAAFEEAAQASAHLARARRSAELAINAGSEHEELPERISSFASELEQTFEAFAKFSGSVDAMEKPSRGFLAFQRWNGGGAASQLFDKNRRKKGDFPQPSVQGFLSEFEIPNSTETDYGIWIRGYVHPAVSGKYKFWISSDDKSELSLSRDSREERANRIAHVETWTPVRSYDEAKSQGSKEIELNAGERYYIEAILDGGSGENHISVVWQPPGEQRSGPIPGAFLSPYLIEVGSNDGEGGRLKYFRENLLMGAQKLNNEVASGTYDKVKSIDQLKDLSELASILRERVRGYVLSAAGAYHANNSEAPDYLSALKRFDAMPRMERIERLLLDETTGILSSLAKQQDIELVALRDDNNDSLWWQRRGGRKSSGDLPAELAVPEMGQLTNLGETLRDGIGSDTEGVGVILLSDGRHNSGSSPIAAAKTLGELGVPVFPIGIGDEKPPQDMALLDISAPDTVYSKDRVKGEFVLNDFMTPGIPYKLRIALDGKTIWEKDIESTHAERREIEYDFPIEDLVKAITEARAKDDLVVRSVPLFFEASVTAADEKGTLERVVENNSKPLFVQAVTEPRRILLLDGRPRWESRYLHNLFERDERWEVNALMKTVFADSEGWERGDKPGQFPASREELFRYSMIIVGDLPKEMLSDDEMSWIADFAGQRGGGVVFIDGQRQNLANYGDSALGKLLPVEFVDAGYRGGKPREADMPKKMELTASGLKLEALRFVTANLENEQIWERLPAPHWVAPTLELAGSEVLANVIIDENRSFPALVTRRYGAGRVLYAGIDEMWRWRYQVGDRYHQKFWVQVTNWVSEKPFAIEDKYVSIAADKLVYDPGKRSDIRVRIRDESGKPVDKGEYVAILYDGLEVVSEIQLEPDPNQGGIFRGRTGELESGRYEIAVREKYFLGKPREFNPRAELVVRAMNQQEMDNLSLNAELLEDVARNSGGQFFFEEEARNLVDLLESIDRKKVISSQTNLWSSYWWFGAILALLTAEWILRKRSGYV